MLVRLCPKRSRNYLIRPRILTKCFLAVTNWFSICRRFLDFIEYYSPFHLDWYKKDWIRLRSCSKKNNDVTISLSYRLKWQIRLYQIEQSSWFVDLWFTLYSIRPLFVRLWSKIYYTRLFSSHILLVEVNISSFYFCNRYAILI